MHVVIVAGAFLFGTIIGSFLNVVILRFHSGRSLSGFSHCLSCGEHLKPYDLIPVISYLALRGRCRTCGAHFSPRYLYVELLTGVLFALVAFHITDPVLLLIHLFFTALLVVILVYDLDHLIIPNELVVGLLPLALLMQSYNSLESTFGVPGWQPFAGALAGFLFFFTLWLVSRGRWIGLGDAKLIVPLALAVGLSSVFSLVVISFWVGAALMLLVLLIRRVQIRGQGRLQIPPQKLTMKSEVPFAPFLIASYFLVMYAGANAFAFINGITTATFPY